MKIAITGATGFLGRHLVDRLSGAHSLVAVSRSGRDVADAVGIAANILDRDALDLAFAGCELVVHAAGKVSHSLHDAAETWALHITGTENVMAAARAAGVKRVVYISTSGTIGVSDDGTKVSDEDSPSPLKFTGGWPYYRSKLFAEEVALAASDDDMAVICLNPSLLLGPGDDVLGQSTAPVRLFLESSVPFPPPGGLSFVDVRDVAEAVQQALIHGEAGQRYLLGAANWTFHAFYQRLARVTGRSAPVARLPDFTRKVLSFLPALARDEEIGIGAKLSREELEIASHYWYIDSSRAERDLGWVPREPLATLEDTVASILNTRQRSYQMYRGVTD